MQLIPFQVSPEEYSIVVVLEADNLARMKESDPAQVNLRRLPEPFVSMRLRDVLITSPSHQDMVILRRLLMQNNGAAALQYLSRGFKFDPRRGDHDDPYYVTNPVPPK